MPKDRFKSQVADLKAFGRRMPAYFDQTCLAKKVAQSDASWRSNIASLLEDERLTPEARKLLEYWLTFDRLSDRQAATIRKLRVWQASSKKMGEPTFGGAEWQVDPERDRRRKERRLAEKNEKRPDWMRDRSKLPLKPPGKE